MNPADTSVVSLAVLAFTPYFIAGVMLISGKWRINTAPKPKVPAAVPVAELVSGAEEPAAAGPLPLASSRPRLETPGAA